jgi:hypothetical protein
VIAAIQLMKGLESVVLAELGSVIFGPVMNVIATIVRNVTTWVKKTFITLRMCATIARRPHAATVSLLENATSVVIIPYAWGAVHFYPLSALKGAMNVVLIVMKTKPSCVINAKREAVNV